MKQKLTNQQRLDWTVNRIEALEGELGETSVFCGDRARIEELDMRRRHLGVLLQNPIGGR